MSLLLRPLVRRAAAAAIPADERPLPVDDPVVRVGGPDPDRVLVIGSGPVSGAGMHRHEDALAGTLARSLAARSGRGAVVETRGRRRVRLVDVEELVRGARLQRFDAIVLVVGLFDAADGARVRPWSRALHRRLDAIQADGARDAVVLLTRIPPVSSIADGRGPGVLLADRVVRRLNDELERAAARRTATACAVLPPPTAGTPVASAAWYRRCGDELADALVPLLRRGRG